MVGLTPQEYAERQEGINSANWILLCRLFAALAETQADPQEWLRRQSELARAEMASVKPRDGVADDRWKTMLSAADGLIEQILLAAMVARTPGR